LKHVAGSVTKTSSGCHRDRAHSAIGNPFEVQAMDIRKLWLTLVERAAPRRRVDHERIRVIRRVLNQLRGREKALLDRRDAVTDDEQRADLANKLSVLRAQRTKGLRMLRELRADMRAVTRGRAPGAEAAGPQEVPVDSAPPERR
jgi:hypothetical protein